MANVANSNDDYIVYNSKKEAKPLVNPVSGQPLNEGDFLYDMATVDLYCWSGSEWVKQ